MITKKEIQSRAMQRRKRKRKKEKKLIPSNAPINLLFLTIPLKSPCLFLVFLSLILVVLPHCIVVCSNEKADEQAW